MLEYDAASPTPVKEGDQRHHNVRDFVNEPQTPQMFIEAVVEKPYGSDTYKLSNYATSITPEATATVTPASVGVDLPSTSTPYATPHAARQDHHSRYAMIQEHSTPLSAPQQFRYTQGGSTTPLQYSTPQTMHHSQSSNEIVLRQQLLQMQEQMALMSRAISQANQMSVVPSTTPSRQDQSMLAFKLGERLGALNKNDEVTRDSIRSVQEKAEYAANEVAAIKSHTQQLETTLKHQAENQTSHSKTIAKLSTSFQDFRNEAAAGAASDSHYRQRTQDWQSTHEQKVAGISESLLSLSQTVNETQQRKLQDVIKDQQHMSQRFVSNLQQLQTLQNELNSLSAQFQNLNVHVSRDAKEQRDTICRLETKLKELQDSNGKEIRLIEKRSVAATKSQIDALRQEISGLQIQVQTATLTAGSAAMAGGSSAAGIGIAVLQSILPFASVDHLKSVASWLAALHSQPRLRKIYAALLLGDVSLRLLERYCPWLSAILSALTGWSELSPTTKMVVRMVRLFFELGVLMQLCLAAWELMQTAKNRTKEKFSEVMEQKAAEIRSSLRKAAIVLLIAAVPSAFVAVAYIANQRRPLATCLSILPDHIETAHLSLLELVQSAQRAVSLEALQKAVRRTSGVVTSMPENLRNISLPQWMFSWPSSSGPSTPRQWPTPSTSNRISHLVAAPVSAAASPSTFAHFATSTPLAAIHRSANAGAYRLPLTPGPFSP